MFKRTIVIASLLVASTIHPGKHDREWLSTRDFKCLVDNIYYEARGEPFIGMVKVGKVTLNRVAQTGLSVCEIVYQKNQFSWTKTKVKSPKMNEWEVAALAAHRANYDDSIATHYHSIKVKPKWRLSLNKLEQVGNHVFYN